MIAKRVSSLNLESLTKDQMRLIVEILGEILDSLCDEVERVIAMFVIAKLGEVINA